MSANSTAVAPWRAEPKREISRAPRLKHLAKFRSILGVPFNGLSGRGESRSTGILAKSSLSVDPGMMRVPALQALDESD